MASFPFLKLALPCLLHFAWPLLALVYPLCASIQAIETDSYDETRDLISYWILLSLIYLFEHAFLWLLQWFQLWPYIKLMVIFCLITPDFGRASCVYDNIIRPYISRNPQAIIFRLSNSRKFSVKKDKFLLYAERDIKENGTEALEKFIASKGTTYKPDAEGTNVVRAIDNEEVQQTGKKLQTEHKDIKDLEDIPVMPNLAPSQKSTSSSTVKTEDIAGEGTAGGELPESCTHKEVQKKWSCALCKFTSTSKQTLNDHLYGRKHRATWEGVSEKNQPVGKNRFKLRCPICNVTCGGVVDMNSHLNGRKHLAQVTDFNLK